ncbi:UNVERIFIED_CONTAM: hypothetical protein Sradi_3786800 [Sesamum radiatum]|uniref:DUF4283 domain-containing protein n=1 Tax=Sesamum radiatum TaxID=300843 RepID=A0AAW2PZW3_SESRA
MPEDLWHAQSNHYQLCSVGQLLVNKNARFEALHTSIQGMLNPVKGMEMRQLDGGRFLLRFNHIIDRNEVLEECPWSFEKNILILSGINKEENPMRVDLGWCDFFVNVHDLPLSMMNLGLATVIGNKLGTFHGMEMDKSRSSWGSTLRIRVALNVKESSKDGGE